MGNDDGLSSGEFVFGSSEGFQGVGHVGVFHSDREQNLSDFDSGGLSVGFSEGSSHSGLESIGSGARKHLVDSQHVPRMDSHLQTLNSNSKRIEIKLDFVKKL